VNLSNPDRKRVRIPKVPVLRNWMSLSQEVIVRTLLAARTRISASAWMVTRDVQAAEDIFQNLSVKALAGGTTFDMEAQLVSWGHITARHEALNWIRDRKGRAVCLDEVVLNFVAQEWEETPEGPRLKALRGCLDGLPRDSRQILDLRYSEERPCEEIAKTLKLGLDAVYQRLSRLHRALKSCTEQRLAT
jgi:RNA polymerase sigma factor (sigma-70 family)